jgi:hypothetical protein
MPSTAALSLTGSATATAAKTERTLLPRRAVPGAAASPGGEEHVSNTDGLTSQDPELSEAGRASERDSLIDRKGNASIPGDGGGLLPRGWRPMLGRLELFRPLCVIKDRAVSQVPEFCSNLSGGDVARMGERLVCANKLVRRCNKTLWTASNVTSHTGR